MKTFKLIFALSFTILQVNSQTPIWQWAKGAGGTSNDRAYSVTLDANGNSYVAGFFQSSTISLGSVILTNNGTANMFLVKYDGNGNALWAKSAGGTNANRAFSVTHDTSGNIYVVGVFSSSSITFDSITLTNVNAASSDMFIVKYDANGNVLWAKSAGGSGTDEAYSVTADALGNILMTGQFTSTTITFGSTTLTNVGNYDLFIVKYDGNGNVIWAKSAGGTDDDDANSVTADANGNIYLTGYFFSANITFGSTTLTNVGDYDLFIVKYDGNGNVIWAKRAGGTQDDEANSVTTDANGNSYVTGLFMSANITFGSITLTNSSNSNYDMFIVKYDVNGNALWAKNAVGTSDDFAYSVTTDANGNIYVAGDGGSITFGSITLNVSVHLTTS